jgi:hypothetical protein
MAKGRTLNEESACVEVQICSIGRVCQSNFICGKPNYWKVVRMENDDGGNPMIESDFQRDDTLRFRDGLLIRKTRLIICVLGFMTRQGVCDG